MKYIIYLLSFTEPKQSTIVLIENDSIMFYSDGYHKERLLWYREDSRYVFSGGFVVIKTNKVLIEWDRKLKKHKIRNVAKS